METAFRPGRLNIWWLPLILSAKPMFRNSLRNSANLILAFDLPASIRRSKQRSLFDSLISGSFT